LFLFPKIREESSGDTRFASGLRIEVDEAEKLIRMLDLSRREAGDLPLEQQSQYERIVG
jgi:hypothetical protein